MDINIHFWWSAGKTSQSISMGLAEEKQQLEMLLRQVKSIQSLSAILPTYAQGITITLLILVVDIML
jgi:hypothetical protein